MRHFLDLTIRADALSYLHGLDEHSVVVYSPTSIKRIGIEPKCNFINAHTLSKNIKQIEKFCSLQKANKIVAIGGGTPIDIAKYIAYLIDCDFVCIPTMLSTNAYATNKVALMQNGRKITLDAKLPDSIILDADIIAKAGVLNLYGLCDILSIHTALCDWAIADKADKEKIDSKIFAASEELLKQALHLSRKIQNPTTKEIANLFALIGESGHITNIYGSGRPESGSEHIFAKELERRVNVPHGISIAIGISLMSHIQDNYSKAIQDALHQIGIIDDVLNRQGLSAAVEASLLNLTPRKDRYTVLDEKKVTDDSAKYLVDMLFKTTQGLRHEYSYS